MHFSEEKLIDQAYAVGKKGNLIKRMREVENAHQSGKTFALKYSFDEQKLKEYVEKECTQFDVKAKNSKLSLKNGRFVAGPFCHSCCIVSYCISDRLFTGFF